VSVSARLLAAGRLRILHPDDSSFKPRRPVFEKVEGSDAVRGRRLRPGRGRTSNGDMGMPEGYTR
jgi:hypothetical protein